MTEKDIENFKIFCQFLDKNKQGKLEAEDDLKSAGNEIQIKEKIKNVKDGRQKLIQDYNRMLAHARCSQNTRLLSGLDGIDFYSSTARKPFGDKIKNIQDNHNCKEVVDLVKKIKWNNLDPDSKVFTKVFCLKLISIVKIGKQATILMRHLVKSENLPDQYSAKLVAKLKILDQYTERIIKPKSLEKKYENTMNVQMKVSTRTFTFYQPLPSLNAIFQLQALLDQSKIIIEDEINMNETSQK